MLKSLSLYALLALLLALSPARASTFTYNVDAVGSFGSFGGQLVLNCNSCTITSSDLVSASFGGEAAASAFTGANLSATPTEIIFTPTTSATSIFDTSHGGFFFGGGGTVGGGPGSPCITTGSGAYGDCRDGVEAAATASGALVIGTLAPTPLPAALPLFASALGGLGFFGLRRKRKAGELAAGRLRFT